jgi:hypothetical protein
VDKTIDDIKRVVVFSDFPLGPSRAWLKFFSKFIDSGKIDLSKFEWCETDIYDLKIYSGM